jgi:adenosylmethionine-8-amino-7-oxononanoate aminotransferase
MKNANTAALLSSDYQNLWHPFTQMLDWTENPQVIVEKGEGNWLIDTEGNRYLDGVSSLWTNVHGHGKAEINQAITKQLGEIAHTTLLGLSTPRAIELADRLIKIAPVGLSKVFYSDSGSTAVEIALKMAFQFHQQNGSKQKTGFIRMTNAYHGDTIGAVSLGGIDLFHATYRNLIFPSIAATHPYCYRCPRDKSYPSCNLACFGALESLVQKHHDNVAALIVEPLVQGAGGMLTQPEGYLRRVRDLCTAHGVLMIADEVAVGFGKTGSMFACEKVGITPDFMCLAKGITGGYLPLAATLTTNRVYEGFLGRVDEGRTFYHGHTYTGNALACAAALANLDLFESEHVLNRLAPCISQLTRLLEKFYTIPSVGDIRQCGVMVGIELVADKATKVPFSSRLRMGHRVVLEARKRGIIIRPLGDTIILMPPLSISESELDLLCDVTFQSIKAATSNV